MSQKNSSSASLTATQGVIIQNLVFAYPQQEPVLRGISLNLKPGERIALLGPTGCGKSTLLENLVGLRQAQSGEICIQGIPVNPSTLAEVRRQVGFAFQDANDQLFMPTILEDVTFGPRNYGVPEAIAKEKAARLLEEFGLLEFAHRSSHELSGGQKRLAALAAILALEPSILILDEPTTGLDPGWRRKLSEILLKLPIEVILIASHDLYWIAKTTQRALILTGGQVREDRPTDELLQQEALLESYGLPLGY
ncbi:MAG: ABC transporter ATP-binding protein [Desertifilum sp. SIO1I2]|nr:ABC transporter ATP-binding protein [Desertifilum sp. SIO1I2]